MKKRFCILFILPLFLLSCSKEKREYYYEDNPFQLIRNGDYFLKDFSSLTYEDLDNDVQVDSTLKSLEYGESFSIIRTSSTCSSCALFKDNFVSFIKDTFLDISVYSSEESQTVPSINKLAEHFPENKIEHSLQTPFMTNTPTWYYGNENKGIKIANWGATDLATLKYNFFRYGSLSNIYKFSSIEALKKGLEDEDSLIYLLDESNKSSLYFYEKRLYPLAIKSSKRTYVLPLSRVKEEDMNEVLSYFGSYCLIYKDKKVSLGDTYCYDVTDDYYN